MKTIITSAISLGWIALSFAVYGQELSLEQCYNAARNKSPIAAQSNIEKSISDLRIKSLTRDKLPQFQLNGQYTYQSDVVEFPEIGAFSFPVIPKNQYRISLDVNQSIFQGNRIKHQIDVEQAGLQSELQQVEVNLNSIKIQINNLYFSALSLQEQEKIYETVIDDLTKRIDQVRSLVKNGVLKPSDEKSLLIEIKKADQEKLNLEGQRQSVLNMLKEVTGLEFENNIGLAIPETSQSVEVTINRPEEKLFSYQVEAVAAQKSLTNLSRLPKLFAFGSVGVGQPNPYNFFKTDASSYYMVGLRLSWTLWDWNNSARSRQIIELQKEKINTQKENFELAINTQVRGAQTNLEKLTSLAEGDQEILDLQSDITKDTFARFRQGVITASEYSTELNKETQAKLKLRIRQIQIAAEQINIRTITGNI